MTNRDTERVWIFVADSRSVEDLKDLDHLDAILWGSNPNTRRGDLVLMYRKAPYSDIAYIFRAGSDPRPTRREDKADTEKVIELTDKVRLEAPLTLARMKQSPTLSRWTFLIQQQGIMRHSRDLTDNGVWPALRRLLVARNPAARILLVRKPAERGGISPTRQSSVLNVFLSYGSEDRQRVTRLYHKLRGTRFLKVWFDRNSLGSGVVWEDAIDTAIRDTDAVVLCLSDRTVRKKGFFQSEIGKVIQVADRQPEGTTFVLPTKLSPCEVPSRLSRWQYTDLFRRGGYERLLAGLRRQRRFLAEGRGKRSTNGRA